MKPFSHECIVVCILKSQNWEGLSLNRVPPYHRKMPIALMITLETFPRARLGAFASHRREGICEQGLLGSAVISPCPMQGSFRAPAGSWMVTQ